VWKGAGVPSRDHWALDVAAPVVEVASVGTIGGAWMMTVLVLVEVRRESKSGELKKTAAGKRR
jgi:hypothetical protein